MAFSRVVQWSAELEREDPWSRQTRGWGDGRSVRFDPPPLRRVRVEALMDEDAFERFCAAMGVNRNGREEVASPALPEATHALPAGPIDAELIDDAVAPRGPEGGSGG